MLTAPHLSRPTPHGLPCNLYNWHVHRQQSGQPAAVTVEVSETLETI